MHGRTAAAFGLLTTVAGLNFVAVKLANEEMAPLWGAGARFAVAGLLLMAFVAVTRRRFPRGRALAGALIYGVLGFGAFYGLMYYGLVSVGPGLASVLLATVPLATFFVAWAHAAEAFRWRGLLGGCIAALGIAVVFWDRLRAGAPLAALAAILLAALATAEAGVTIKRFPRGDPFATNAVAMVSGAVLLLAASLVSREPWTPPATHRTWGVFVYLVVIGSVVLFGLFLYVISRWTASATSYLFVLAPLVTITASAALTQETFRREFFLGAALVLWGTYEGAIRGVSAGRPGSVRRPAPPAEPPEG